MNAFDQKPEVLLLSGGVGGARLARGFSRLDAWDTTVVVNTGDDDWVYGVYVSPDLDTVVYTLAETEGPQGWGRANETWGVMDALFLSSRRHHIPIGRRRPGDQPLSGRCA